MTVAMSSSPPASPELPNAVPDASSADGTAGSSGSAATADLASSPSANGAVATMPNGAARLQRNKRVIQSKVQGMGMISHVRRRSVIASTYGVELSPEDDRHSPEARKSATADYGATFKGRERGTGEQPTCCDRCFPIQTEDSKFRKTWDKIQIVALLYVAVLVPIRSGFDLEDLELEPLHFDWWIDVLVDLYFIADIFTNFRQGYQDVDGSMEMRPKKIAINYARSWLIIDIVSCLPIQYILHISDALQNVDANDAGGRDAGGQAAQIKGIKILRLLRLTKLLRLARVKRIIRRYEDHFEGLGSFVKLITATVVVLYTAHLIACFWHAVGGDENDPRGNLVQGWINTEWPEAVGNSSAITFGERYLTSMYWSITTLSTVGFGDISPQTQMERVFCLFAEIFGCLMFATIIGTVSSVAMGQKLLEEKVTRQLAELREFLASKGISRDLRIRVRRYMETLYAAKTGFDEAEVLAQLPPPMAQEVIDCLYHEQIRNVPMFRSLEDGALATICMRMRPFKAMREDWIYKTGEAGREMYIIIDGKVALRGPRGPPRLLNTGAVFGEGCVSQLVAELEWQNSSAAMAVQGNGTSRPRPPFRMTQPHIRTTDATAESDCDLRFLTLSDLDEIGRSYPSLIVELSTLFKKRRRHSSELHSAASAAVKTPTPAATAAAAVASAAASTALAAGPVSPASDISQLGAGATTAQVGALETRLTGVETKMSQMDGTLNEILAQLRRMAVMQKTMSLPPKVKT